MKISERVLRITKSNEKLVSQSRQIDPDVIRLDVGDPAFLRQSTYAMLHGRLCDRGIPIMCLVQGIRILFKRSALV